MKPLAVPHRAIRGTKVTTAGLNLVFVSAEVTPWSKTGGLGDVVSGLPIELAKLGHKVMTIAPRWAKYRSRMHDWGVAMQV